MLRKLDHVLFAALLAACSRRSRITHTLADPRVKNVAKYLAVLALVAAVVGCSGLPQLGFVPTSTPFVPATGGDGTPAVSPSRAGTAFPSTPPTPALAIQEYRLAPGSHPHAVALAADGSVWYAAAGSGEMGRLDPSTGNTDTIKLGLGSAPQDIAFGPDGAIWLADSGLNALVRVDVRIGQVRRYTLPPERGNAQISALTFDHNGVLWFAGDTGMYGRFDLQNCQMDVYDAPGGPGPAGITVSGADVYYASGGGNLIARIDAGNGQAASLAPPTAGQGARYLQADPVGRVWVSEWNAGQVGMYDPAANQWREWKLPGQKPQPDSVYVDRDNHVWLTDASSNAVVRFDPGREAFQTFLLPTPSSGVQSIQGRPGEVWAAESDVDKLVVIRMR